MDEGLRAIKNEREYKLHRQFTSSQICLLDKIFLPVVRQKYTLLTICTRTKVAKRLVSEVLTIHIDVYYFIYQYY
jgi:hypothetical protein